MENYGNIIHRTKDDSYVIKDGTYHVPNNGEWTRLWEQVHAYALANPAMVTEEYPYTPSLDELKTAKLQEVDQWTASKITGGFISGGVRYDSDMETQTTMQGIALNVNTERFATDYPHGIPVRGYDEGATEKTIHYLTAEEVLMFCADLSEHIGRCKLDGWTMQQAVLEATAKEELDSIILD